MKIFKRPYEKLVLLGTAAAVATGTGAGICAEKFGGRFRTGGR
jgi:hypothetical protein